MTAFYFLFLLKLHCKFVFEISLVWCELLLLLGLHFCFELEASRVHWIFERLSIQNCFNYSTYAKQALKRRASRDSSS